MNRIFTDADLAELADRYVHDRASQAKFDDAVSAASGLTVMHSGWRETGEAPYLLRAAAASVVHWKFATTGREYDVGRDTFRAFIEAYKARKEVAHVQ